MTHALADCEALGAPGHCTVPPRAAWLRLVPIDLEPPAGPRSSGLDGTVVAALTPIMVPTTPEERVPGDEIDPRHPPRRPAGERGAEDGHTSEEDRRRNAYRLA